MRDASTAPFVSIVMPIRNEAGFIARSLEAVLAQDYPSDRFEILVAEGMSTDGTREIVKSFQARHAKVRLLDNPGRIVPTGLNAALAQARGEIVIRVDGHCEIAPDYVRRCVEHLRRDGADGVGGPLDTVGSTAVAEVIATAMSCPFGVGGCAFRTRRDQTMFTDTVPFPAYTRAIMDQAGPFDEELVRDQDDEYNYRLRRLGAKILLAADVRCRYFARSSFRSLWRQYFGYGYWKVRVLQKHPRQMQLRQFAPPLLIVGVLLPLLLIPFAPAGAYLSALVAGSYLVASLVASLLVARKRLGRIASPSYSSKREWGAFLLLPAIFATLHIAYGLGFLAGLAAFSSRWRDRS
jgi:glycosyltransferase involved in cell wall biosynthesis